MAAESDLLLLLAQNQPDQVPQKLYEYLGTRVPIIAFVDRGGETARMLERVGGHHTVFDNDVDAAVRALESVLGTSENEPAGDPAVLEGWTADTQLKRFIDALGV